MEKFNKTIRGYNPKEVNAFLDDVIGKVEKIVAEKNEREKQYLELLKKMKVMEEQIERYKAVESTLNKTIVAAQDNGEQIRRIAKHESEIIIGEARRNANRIINEALLRAEKTEYKTNLMRKNVNVFKQKLRNLVESQLEMIDDVEILEI